MTENVILSPSLWSRLVFRYRLWGAGFRRVSCPDIEWIEDDYVPLEPLGWVEIYDSMDDYIKENA